MEKVSGSSAQSGGELGNIRRFKKQLTSLLMSRIIYWTNDEERTAYKSMEVSSSGLLFWNPGRPNQRGLLQSSIQMGQSVLGRLHSQQGSGRSSCHPRFVGLRLYGTRRLCVAYLPGVHQTGDWPHGLSEDLLVSSQVSVWPAICPRAKVSRSVPHKPYFAYVSCIRGSPSMNGKGRGLAFRFNRPSILVLPGQEVGRVPSEATKFPGTILHLKRPQKSTDPSA